MLLAQDAEQRRRYPETMVVGWRRKVPPLALSAAAMGVYFVGLMILDISPAKIVSGIGRLFDIVELMLPPDPESWARVLLYLGALGQTLAIAFLGTMLGAALGCPFGLLAARNVVANRLVHLLTRRSLDTVRSVDILIWALIWINVVGLGPFAGALAIISADLGAFGKLVSEAIEAADRRPTDGRWPLAAAAFTACVSAYCRRCCRSSPVSCCISSSPTPAPPRSSVSSAPAGLVFSYPSRSAYWSGNRLVS